MTESIWEQQIGILFSRKKYSKEKFMKHLIKRINSYKGNKVSYRTIGRWIKEALHKSRPRSYRLDKI